MGNYIKKEWTLDTFHKGDKEFLNGLNHMEQGIADAGSGTGVYKYKGTKENYADLPTSGNEVGDVWNVINAYEHYPAGTNFAWTGTAWDALGGSIDLSVFRKAADQDVIDNGIKDRLAAIEGDYLKAADKTDLQNNINLKQDIISDLADIRDGAAKGKTAIQEHQDISGKQDKLTAGNGISLDNNTVTIKPADRSISVGEFGVHVPVITTSLDVTDRGLAVKLADDTIEAYNSGTGTKGIRVNTNKIQSKLSAGDGINIDANNKISADVRTYKPFPSSWPHTTGTTIASFCAAVNASYKAGEIKIGDAFLGNVTSPIFFSGAYVEEGGSLGSAEVSVQIMTPFGQNCVQLLTTTSSNNAPYHWEYTYVDGAVTEGWRCWSQHSYVNNKLSLKQDKLTAGNNVQIAGGTISATDTVYTAGTGIDITNKTISNTVSPLVPNQASSTNKLADKAFVTDAVSTASANFRNTWSTYTAIPTDASQYPQDYTGSTTPTTNDYLVVQNASDYTAETISGTWRFKYSGLWSSIGKAGWLPEYQISTEPLTSEQLAALNSGVTSSTVSQVTTNTTAIAGKQDKLTAGSHININDNEISVTVNTIFDMIYPVGSYHFGVTAPTVGTWEKVNGDRAIWIKSDASDGTNIDQALPIPSIASTFTGTQGSTSLIGNHSHNTSSDGNHNHDRGDMNIYGLFDTYWYNMNTTGALFGERCDYDNPMIDTSQKGTYRLGINAANNWTGHTNTTGSHTHTIDAQGAHTHTYTPTGNVATSVTADTIYKSGANVQPNAIVMTVWKRIS